MTGVTEPAGVSGSHDLDPLAAGLKRRRRNLFIAMGTMETIGIALAFLGFVVLESMTVVWIGAGLVLLAFLLLVVGLATLNRSGVSAADQLITPPGARP